MHAGSVPSLIEHPWNAAESEAMRSRRLGDLVKQVLPPRATAIPPSAQEIMRRPQLLAAVACDSHGLVQNVEDMTLPGMVEIDSDADVTAGASVATLPLLLHRVCSTA